MTGKTTELVVSNLSVDSFCRLSIRTDNYIKKYTTLCLISFLYMDTQETKLGTRVSERNSQ